VGTRSYKPVVIVSILGVLTAVIFQNCGVNTSSTPIGTNQNVQVLCSPANDCLHYSLTTYGASACAGGYNKVVVDNYPSVNGSDVTNVLWSNCLVVSTTEACCPSGLVTAKFQTFSGDRSILISFENSPTALISTSNKIENMEPQ
jgi:hypothetical protein